MRRAGAFVLFNPPFAAAAVSGKTVRQHQHVIQQSRSFASAAGPAVVAATAAAVSRHRHVRMLSDTGSEGHGGRPSEPSALLEDE